MDGRRLRAGLVLVLVVVALGAAGASMGDAGGGGSSTGLGDGSGSGLGSGADGIVQRIQELHPWFDGEYLATAIGVAVVLGALVCVVGLALGLVSWDWEQFRSVLRSYAGKAVGLVAVGVLLWLFLQAFSLPTGGGSTGFGGEGNGQSGGPVSDATGLQLPAILGIAVAAALVVAVLLLLQRSGEGEAGAEDTDVAAAAAAERSSPLAAVGDASTGSSPVGMAAADNEVYRAWLALASAAGANARRDTPDAVEDRALEQGIDADATREITSLFEHVRYGRLEPDAAIEERARRARSAIAGER